ncbi:MAG: ABC transporter permease [Erysipelotrichaceae bacterium]|nr:ABC transporter permease [Erysipelotrichaceae bacterium]MCB9499816.1 ABC transporter permease [Erysipelotrichaceae bacterium]
MSEINVSRIIPTILLLAGVIILLYTLKSKTLNKNNKLIGYIVSGSLGIVSILFIILFATKVLGVVTFDWGLFIILILISAYKITKLAFEFKDKKKVKVKEIIVASIFLLLTILVMVLSLTGFFNSLTMNWFIPIMIVLVCIAYFVLYKTKFGLRLMACGENPAAADAVGINVTKMRYIGVCISGCLAGIGGIAFIASVNSSWSFDVGVSGFGFLALAVMIFGQWKPINIMLGATLFGFFRAIGLTYVVIPFLSNMNLNPTWYSMLPYIVCLIVLAFTSRKSRAPKAEGIPYDKATR